MRRGTNPVFIHVAEDGLIMAPDRRNREQSAIVGLDPTTRTLAVNLDEFEDYPEDDFEEAEETEVVDDLDDELPSVDVYDDEAYYYDPYEGYEEEEVAEPEADNICTECDGTGEFPEDHLCKGCNGKGYIGE